MACGSIAMMDFLWQNALAAVPLVLIVAAICRLAPCRPSTRHFLWLLVLAMLVAPRFAPPQQLTELVSSGLAWADRAESTPEAAAAQTEPRLAPNLRSAREVVVAGSGIATIESLHVAAGDHSAIHRQIAEGQDGLGEEPGVRRAPRLRRKNHQEDAVDLPDAGRVSLAVPQLASPGGRPLSRPDSQLSPRPSASRRAEARWELEPERPHSMEGTSPWQVEDGRTGAIRPPVGRVAGIVESNQLVTGIIPEFGSGLAEIEPVGEANQTVKNTGKRSMDRTVAVIGIIRRFIGDQAAHWSAQWSVWSERSTQLGTAIAGLPPLPTNLWLLGVVSLLAITWHRMIKFRALLSRAVPVPHRVQGEILRAANEIGLKSPPPAVMVRQRVSPMIVCGPRPRLVLPVKLWSQLDRMSRHAVLCHELAHLKRRDHWVSWIEWIIGVVYWWNPLVWWVRQKLHEEAELCCDQWVTWLLPRQRRTYAVALLKAKEYVSRNNSVAPAMSMGATTQRTRKLVRRIKMVMTGTAKPKLSILGMAFACTLVLVAWMAGPAWACPPEAQKAKVAAAPCAKCDDKCKCECNSSTCKGRCCSACQAKADSMRAYLVKPPKPPAAWKRGTGSADEAATTFERYLSGRKAPKAKQGKAKSRKAPKPSAKKNATNSVWSYTVPQAAPFAVVSGDGDGDEGAENRLERRLRRLERQIERLAEQIERTAAGRGRGNRSGPVPIAPWFLAPPASGGPTMTRSYELPQGKLKALTQLMIRQDVPVLVSPHDDHIDVQGTERQQAIFKAFVDMIHPDGRSSADTPFWQEQSLATEALAQRLAFEGEARTSEIRARIFEQRAREFQDRSEQLENRAEELQDAAENLHEEMKQKALEQAATLRNQAEMLQEQAERAEREAEELRVRAEELTERTESLANFLDVLQQQGRLPGSEAWLLPGGIWEGVTAGVTDAIEPLEIGPVLVPEQPHEEQPLELLGPTDVEPPAAPVDREPDR